MIFYFHSPFPHIHNYTLQNPRTEPLACVFKLLTMTTITGTHKSTWRHTTTHEWRHATILQEQNVLDTGLSRTCCKATANVRLKVTSCKEWRMALGRILTFSCHPCCQGLALKPWGRFRSFLASWLIWLTWAHMRDFNNLDPISCSWQRFLIYTKTAWLPWKPMPYLCFCTAPPSSYQVRCPLVQEQPRRRLLKLNYVPGLRLYWIRCDDYQRFAFTTDCRGSIPNYFQSSDQYSILKDVITRSTNAWISYMNIPCSIGNPDSGLSGFPANDQARIPLSLRKDHSLLCGLVAV